MASVWVRASTDQWQSYHDHPTSPTTQPGVYEARLPLAADGLVFALRLDTRDGHQHWDNNSNANYSAIGPPRLWLRVLAGHRPAKAAGLTVRLQGPAAPAHVSVDDAGVYSFAARPGLCLVRVLREQTLLFERAVG